MKPLFLLISLSSVLTFSSQSVAIPLFSTWTRGDEANFQERMAVLNRGETTVRDLPKHSIRVVFWNMLKAEKPQWHTDTAALMRNVDLILFQEFSLSADVIETLRRNGRLHWAMTPTFNHDPGVPTGVATGSVARPLSERRVLSPANEPVANTPKSSVVSVFQISGRSERLMVVNVHALNFVAGVVFQMHVDQIGRIVRAHRGPVLVAGDFNTWEPVRAMYLDQVMASVALKELSFPKHRTLTLDRAYLRGLAVRSYNVRFDINSSDHKPHTIEFDVIGR